MKKELTGMIFFQSRPWKKAPKSISLTLVLGHYRSRELCKRFKH